MTQFAREAEEAFGYLCSPASAAKQRHPRGQSLWAVAAHWFTRGVSTGLQLQPTPAGTLCAPASRNSKAVSARPSEFMQPQLLTAGCTNPPGKQGGCSDSRSPQTSARLACDLSLPGDSVGIPCCVSPGASPHRDLSLCPCGHTDPKVYSNPSGSGTATCLGPSLGNGPAFSLTSPDDDNYSRGPEALQGKDRYPQVNKLIAKSNREQKALTSCISGKALGKARPEGSLRTRFPCYREGVPSPPCSVEVLANSSRPQKEGKKTHSLSFFLPGSCHNCCSQLSAAHRAGLYRGIPCEQLGREPGEVRLLFTAREENKLYVLLDSGWTWGI